MCKRYVMFFKKIKGSDKCIYYKGVKYGIAEEDDDFIMVKGKEDKYNKFSKHDINKFSYYGDVPYDTKMSMLRGD